MLYIEDDKRTLWPSVARSLASLLPLDMVLCLYPGQDEDDFADPFAPNPIGEWFERITTYEDGDEPPSSARVRIDEQLLTFLEEHSADLEEWGDSLLIFRPEARDIIAGFIPHEGVIVVADAYGSSLAADGFMVSDEPPEWW